MQSLHSADAFSLPTQKCRGRNPPAAFRKAAHETAYTRILMRNRLCYDHVVQ